LVKLGALLIKLGALLLGVLVKPREPVGEPVKPGSGEYTRRSSESGRASGESEAREDTRRSNEPWGTSSDSSFVHRLRVIDPSSLSGIRVLDRRVIGH
jgi:hypothetical protein